MVVQFYESSRWYDVTTASGRTLATRRFGVDADINLSAVDLELPGDSVAFSGRGIATPLGLARDRFVHGGRDDLPGLLQQHGRFAGR